MIQTVTTVEARDKFSRLVNRVAFGNEKLVITRHGIKLAALIPFQDYVSLLEEAPQEDWLETLDNALHLRRKR